MWKICATQLDPIYYTHTTSGIYILIICQYPGERELRGSFIVMSTMDRKWLMFQFYEMDTFVKVDKYQFNLNSRFNGEIKRLLFKMSRLVLCHFRWLLDRIQNCCTIYMFNRVKFLKKLIEDRLPDLPGLPFGSVHLLIALSKGI